MSVSRTIKKVVKAYLNFRVFKFGDMFIRQVPGVPIGGWLSSALLNLSAGACESIFMSRWNSYAQRHHISTRFEETIAAVRYEDDVLGISFKLCGDCVYDVVRSAYLPHIVMEPSDDHLESRGDITKNKYVDLVISGNYDSVEFDVYNCNEIFALTGENAMIRKNRFCPPIGSPTKIIDRLVSNILTKRARWQQTMISQKSIIRHVILDILELLRLGYHRKYIFRAYHKAIAHDRYYALALDTAKNALTNAVHHKLPWKMPQEVLDVLFSMYDVQICAYPLPTVS